MVHSNGSAFGIAAGSKSHQQLLKESNSQGGDGAGRPRRHGHSATDAKCKQVVTSPHSGHFMTSNLDDDDDYVDGLGRGLGVEGPDPFIEEGATASTTSRTSFSGIATSNDNGGYNFSNACKTTQEVYRFTSGSKDKRTETRSFDPSLSKLFACMSLAYSGKLTTPKFKAFKGMKINVWDKMRLNNIIWREWHLQFVRKHNPLVCSFTIHMDDTLINPQAVVLEGKYWKRKLDIVCVEYQKWRVFYKMIIKPKTPELQLGQSKHDSEDQISELLNRVADRGVPAVYPAQTSNLQIEDDLKMDFSDTLFTALAQMPPPPTSQGFTHSDFMQPNLMGLQPTLDDLDSMEPFQDLIAEALSWNSTASHHNNPAANIFGGSLNNLSLQEPKQGLEAAFTFPNASHGSDFILSSNTLSLDDTIPEFTDTTLAPLHHNNEHLSNNQISARRGPALPAPPSYAAVLPLNRSNTQLTSSFTPANSHNHSSQLTSWYAPMEVMSTHHTRSNQQPQQPQTILPASIPDDFVKPKGSVRRQPRSIAPKVPSTSVTRVSSGATTTTSKVSSTTQSSRSSLSSSSTILAHLLTNKSAASNLTDLANHRFGSKSTPSSPSTQSRRRTSGELPSSTLVPSLVATSGSSQQVVASNTISTLQGSAKELDSHSPQSTDELIPSSLLGADERRDPPTSAEHKRRCHIKNGFETIQTLIPALANHPTNKVSKAAMLQKTAEFAQKLKTERQQMQSEAEVLQQEIDALNSAISTCHSQLPATGVPVTRQHNDQMKMMLNSYIRERTNQNWKFYVFGQLVTPLFDSFNNMVSTVSIEELYRTTQTWLDQHCTLPALRPAVSNSLKEICVKTSILSDPLQFPDEAREAMVQSRHSTSSSNPGTPSSMAASPHSVKEPYS